MVIPVLFIGSFAVLFNSFPDPVYQKFLDIFCNGALRSFIVIIQTTTVGILSVYMTVSLNLSYMSITEEGQKLVSKYGSLLGSLTGFFILVGFFSKDFNAALLSGQGIFSALTAGILGSILFQKFERLFRNSQTLFVDGSDSVFNAMLNIMLPFLCVISCFALVNYIITVCFDVQCLQQLFIKAAGFIFIKMNRSYFSGLLFIFITSLLWCFGIHGNNVLENVAINLFAEIIPGQVVSKTFIDTFVYMGGTGTTLGLLISIIIFCRRSSLKKLSRMAALPILFNINELVVFGLPVIYNPLIIIPFIIVPELTYSIAYIFTKAGFLPEVVKPVIWTTPAFLSGFIATASWRGILVQVINICVSVLLYAPFVIRYERKSLNELSDSMNELVGILKKCEETTEDISLLECEGNAGRLAKLLANDLEDTLKSSRAAGHSEIESPLLMKYQPQFDNKGSCIGAEALLRWNHKKFGIVYPPLVVHLAKESGLLYTLETLIFEQSIKDSCFLRNVYGDKFKLSVNVTVTTLYDERFVPFLESLVERFSLKPGNICIEITEETELVTNEETGNLLRKIKALGFTFALDDFSMGHTSLQYLQHNQFDMVKLDGNLVRSILSNERTKEIINSIVYLSKSLGFNVIAEFVETDEQKKALENIGCLLYQGYLYSPAVDCEALLKFSKA